MTVESSSRILKIFGILGIISLVMGVISLGSSLANGGNIAGLFWSVFLCLIRTGAVYLL